MARERTRQLTIFLIVISLVAVAYLGLSLSQPTVPEGGGPSIPATSPEVNKEKQADLFPIWQNGKTGFIDNTGRVVIAPQFPPHFVTGDFSEGMARIQITADDKPGLLL